MALQGAGDCEQWQLQRELSLLKVPEEALDRPFATLSGGEQTRLLMAALFAGEGAFPLIDEPTNHLDQQGRRQLARYLQGKEGFFAGIPRPGLFGRLCGPHPLHQPADHPGPGGQLFPPGSKTGSSKTPWNCSRMKS